MTQIINSTLVKVRNNIERNDKIENVKRIKIKQINGKIRSKNLMEVKVLKTIKAKKDDYLLNTHASSTGIKVFFSKILAFQ